MAELGDFLTPEQKNDRTMLNEMDPWDVIESSAVGMGIQINKPNKNCKHCHGRGWIGRRCVADTNADGSPKLDQYGKPVIIKEPIPCKCIFPKEAFENEVGDLGMYTRPRNRAERRAREKQNSRKSNWVPQEVE